jgi:signal transduction histidine kinase
MLTGSADHALAVAAVRDGAQDYLVKGETDGEKLARAIRYAVLRQQSSARERALAQEHASRVAAEEGVRARDEFLSIVSHELRTPLTSLRLGIDHVQRLVDGGADAASISARLDSAARRVGRLTSLVDQILDVSRIEAGVLALDRRSVDLAEVARSVVERLERAAASASCAIELRTRENVVGEWDRRAIEQVVANLVSNALKYGAGKPVAVETMALGGTATLRVRDQGIGVAPEDVARLFERFGRVVSPRHYGGLGLGLYIARRLVEAHGGTIGVASERNVGSTFTVRLPCRSPATA